MYENVHTWYSFRLRVGSNGQEKDQDTYYQRCSGRGWCFHFDCGTGTRRIWICQPRDSQEVMKSKQLAIDLHCPELEDQAEQDYWVFPIIHHQFVPRSDSRRAAGSGQLVWLQRSYLLYRPER